MDEGGRGEGAPAVVLPVQELVAGHGAPDDDVPARFVARAHHDDEPAAVTAAPIAVIDLGRLAPVPAGRRRRRRGCEPKAGARVMGPPPVLVANHGIEASLMDDMMDSSREFFRQPPEAKKKHTNMVDGKHFRLEGYGNDQVRSEDQVLDWCDRLYLKVEPQGERNLALWPKHPKRFRDALHQFTAECTRLKDRLLPELEKMLELEDDYFGKQFSNKAETFARLSYYPPCPRPELVFGLKPHSDATFISVLMVDSKVGGLQVLRDGVWYDVPTRPHTC